MELEEQQHKPPKKNKLKKIPQRGVGVAQLEKLRCMEEQKRIASIAVSSSSVFSSQDLVSPPPPPATAVMKPQATSNFFSDQQHQRRQPPPPGFFPMLWNAAIEAKGDAPPMKKIAVPVPQRKEQLPLVDSRTCHRMEPPSSQSNSSSYDLLSCWRSERDKNSVEMTAGNKWPPQAFHLDEVIVTRNQEAYLPHKHPVLSSEFSPANGSNLIKLEFQAVRGNSSTPFVGLTSSDLYIERRKCNGGAHDGSFLTLASVSTPSLLRPFDIPQHYQYDHSDFSLQNTKKARKKETVNASSSNELPFYDFLLPGSVRNEKTTVIEIRESPDGDIDLDLRL